MPENGNSRNGCCNLLLCYAYCACCAERPRRLRADHIGAGGSAAAARRRHARRLGRRGRHQRQRRGGLPAPAGGLADAAGGGGHAAGHGAAAGAADGGGGRVGSRRPARRHHPRRAGAGVLQVRQGAWGGGRVSVCWWVGVLLCWCVRCRDRWREWVELAWFRVVATAAEVGRRLAVWARGTPGGRMPR